MVGHSPRVTSTRDAENVRILEEEEEEEGGGGPRSKRETEDPT